MLFIATLQLQRARSNTVTEANQDLAIALLTFAAYTLIQFFLVGRDKEEKENG